MNFDTIIDRNGTGALKWNAPKLDGKSDAIPLWVADMDFAAPEAVTAALRARIEHPVFGYTNPDPSYFEALRAWYATRYAVKADLASFLIGPGVVPAMAIAVRTFSAPGEGVLVMPPVYYPFGEVVRDNDRVVVEAPLIAADPFRMCFDPAVAEKAVADAASRGVKVRMLLFCSPHNPGGVVWKKEELAALLDFARKRDLIVISDEIHGDLVFKPNVFISLAGFSGA
ncbi:MAG: aminotransferase class I/II-fold pyridoxal phosphate-dependent enzyme, partial [Treponemataceae bacterium]